MKRKVLIEKKENHVWTFFLEEDQIAEIHCTKSDEQEKVHQIGDIYVAKVQNIVQNIGAAFLEIEPGSSDQQGSCKDKGSDSDR